MGNKVRFNIKNIHIAVVDPDASDFASSYGTPLKLPGAVALNLEQNGELTPFYADGIKYYTAVSNNGYSGDAEVALVPDEILAAVWKIVKDSKGVIVEASNEEPADFALLYQIDGDVNNDYYVLYNCKATRPGIGSSTNTTAKEPKTQTLTIDASPRDDNNYVMARTTAETEQATKDSWFTSVYIPAFTPPTSG